MCVTTMWARSSDPMPSASSPRRTASTDVVGPVSTSAGRSASSRYAEVSRGRPNMAVSIPRIPSAAWNVSTTGGVYPRPSWAMSAPPARLQAVEGGGGWYRRQRSSCFYLSVLLPYAAKLRVQDVAHAVQNGLLIVRGSPVRDAAFFPAGVQQVTLTAQPGMGNEIGEGI